MAKQVWFFICPRRHYKNWSNDIKKITTWIDSKHRKPSWQGSSEKNSGKSYKSGKKRSWKGNVYSNKKKSTEEMHETPFCLLRNVGQ